MSNYTPGYYWVYRFKGQQKPEIAVLTKNGWNFIGGNGKMGRPFEILYRVEDYKGSFDNEKYSCSR